MKNKLPKQNINFSEWYTQIVQKAGLADYGPVKGTMVIKPYGFQLWENIKDSFDSMIKKNRARECIFPSIHSQILFSKRSRTCRGFCKRMRNSYPYKIKK